MDKNMVKSQETRNTIRLISWRKDARKSISKESMIDSHAVIEWLKIIATKNFAENGMLLRMKIIPTIWPHKNTLSTRVTGGFIRTSKVPILCHWRTDLTSNRHCLPCNNWNKKQKEPHKRPLTLAETNNGHRVLLLGGIGKVLGGIPYSYESHDGDEPSTDRVGWRVDQYLEQIFWAKLSWIQLLCYRWIVYSWQWSIVTDGWCKHNTSNDMFSRCKSVQ